VYLSVGNWDLGRVAFLDTDAQTDSLITIRHTSTGDEVKIHHTVYYSNLVIS